MITSIDQLDLTKQYTYADYLTWQFEDRVELIRGWVHKMSPAPLRLHQRISARIFFEIENYLVGKSCEAYYAPFDVRLVNKRKSTPDREVTTVVQPDICVICDKSKLDDKGCIGAPDWIIEILSPGNTKKEINTKFALYEENEVREYWVVYPEYLQIQVFDLVAGKFIFRKTYTDEELVPVGIFEGFNVDAGHVFGG